jgi:predicted nuclease of predicted toxin-antitoxin system
VRFLIDECLPPFLGAVLRSAGHDAVAALDLCGVPDSIVMATAREQRRVLVSADTDFGEILARSNDRQPSVVLSEAARSSMRRRSGRFC